MWSKGDGYQPTDKNPAGPSEQLCGLPVCHSARLDTGFTEWTENASDLSLGCCTSGEGSRLVNCVVDE